MKRRKTTKWMLLPTMVFGAAVGGASAPRVASARDMCTYTDDWSRNELWADLFKLTRNNTEHYRMVLKPGGLLEIYRPAWAHGQDGINTEQVYLRDLVWSYRDHQRDSDRFGTLPWSPDIDGRSVVAWCAYGRDCVSCESTIPGGCGSRGRRAAVDFRLRGEDVRIEFTTKLDRLIGIEQCQ